MPWQQSPQLNFSAESQWKEEPLILFSFFVDVHSLLLFRFRLRGGWRRCGCGLSTQTVEIKRGKSWIKTENWSKNVCNPDSCRACAFSVSESLFGEFPFGMPASPPQVIWFSNEQNGIFFLFSTSRRYVNRSLVRVHLNKSLLSCNVRQTNRIWWNNSERNVKRFLIWRSVCVRCISTLCECHVNEMGFIGAVCAACVIVLTAEGRILENHFSHRIRVCPVPPNECYLWLHSVASDRTNLINSLKSKKIEEMAHNGVVSGARIWNNVSFQWMPWFPSEHIHKRGATWNRSLNRWNTRHPTTCDGHETETKMHSKWILFPTDRLFRTRFDACVPV